MTESATTWQQIQKAYGELRQMARHMLRAERTGHDWRTTELVHEGVERVLKTKYAQQASDDLGSCLGLIINSMKRALIDHARYRSRARRPGGGGRIRVALDDAPLAAEESPHLFLDVAALIEDIREGRTGKIRFRDPAMAARIVELAWLAGLSEREIAEVLAIPRSTVGNQLRAGRAWIAGRLAQKQNDTGHD